MADKQVAVYFFYALLLLTLGVLFLMFWPFLDVLVLAIIFAVLLSPVYSWVCSYFNLGPRIAAFLVIIFTALIVILLLSAFFSQIVFQARDFYFSVQESKFGSLNYLVETIETSVQNFFPQFEINFQSYVVEGSQWLAARVGKIFSHTLVVFLKLFLWLLILFFFLKDGASLRQSIIRISPLPDKHDEEILARIAFTIRTVFRAFLVIGIIQGILAGVGLAVVGVPNAMLWGAVTGLTALVPGVGPSVVIIPAVIYLWFNGAFVLALGLLAWGLLAVGLVDNLLGPYLYSKGLPLSQIFMLLAVLGGIFLFGPIGLILGPTILSVLVTLLTIFRQPNFLNP